MNKTLLVIAALLSIIVVLLVIFLFQSKGVQNKISVEKVTPKPRANVYVGAWVQDFWSNDKKSLNVNSLKDFEELINKKMAIANIYSEWPYLESKELVQKLNIVSLNGWVPMISANPFFFEKCKDNGRSLYESITEGQCDEFLRNAARNLKSYEKPIFFRFAWEMNLPDMYWSVQKVGSKPSDFANAWKRMHQIFKEEAADNVVWILSFNTSHAKTIPYKELYPGDEYVDWVAIDGYNWGDSHDWSGWASFSGVFKNSYDELTAITNKPVMLSEVNSAPTGGNKSEWLRDMLDIQIPNNFTQIEAIVFFNENKQEGESVDWRFEKSEDYSSTVKESLKAKIYESYYP